MLNILERYIFKQMLMTTLVISLILTSIIWLTQSLRFLELIVDGGAPVSLFGYLLILSVPKFLEIAVPIAIAIAIIFIVNKMVMDSELSIYRSIGLSYRNILKPVLYLSLIVAIALFFMSAFLTPKSNKELDRMRDIIKSDYSSALLRDGVFNAIGNDLTVYIAERQGTQQLTGIMIHSTKEKGPPVTVLAETGRLLNVEDEPYIVVYDGVRQSRNARTGHVETLNFEEYSINISSLQKQSINSWVDEGERTLPELWAYVNGENPRKRLILPFWAEIHTRIARPFLVFAFSVMTFSAMFAGRFNRRGQQRKITVSAVTLILLQGLFLAFSNLATDGIAGVMLLYAISILPIFIGLYLIRRYDSPRAEHLTWRRRIEGALGLR